MRLEDPAVGHDEWFLDWVLRSPKEAGHHLTAGYLAYDSLTEVYCSDDITSAREYFGGMGAQSLMIQDTFGPERHTVMDYSAEAVKHIAREVPSVLAMQADAYDGMPAWPADLVGLDFGDLTAWKTREGQPHRELLDRVFEASPKAVVLTDIACRYLHLHRERYESLLGEGTCASYPQYLAGLLARLQDLYGYRLHRGYWDRWSAVMALVPHDMEGRPLLFETPPTPLGLDLF